eukprot:6185742-Pleurochrysis_carterae.AAC.2
MRVCATGAEAQGERGCIPQFLSLRAASSFPVACQPCPAPVQHLCKAVKRPDQYDSCIMCDVHVAT